METPADSTGIKLERLADNQGSAPMKRPAARGKESDPQELREACQQFEEIFLRMVLKEANINRSIAGEGGTASSLYNDLTRETLAKAMSQSGGVGLAEVLYQQLSSESFSADGEKHHSRIDSTSNNSKK